jgi:branched-chain amino acid transport system permease protein
MDFGFLFRNLATLTYDGLTLGAIYALIALGYTLVYGVLFFINLAHSEIFMLGTLGSLFAVQATGLSKTDPAPALAVGLLTFAVSLVVAMLVSGVSAVALERVAYRPLRRRSAPRLAALISAIGASLAISEAIAIRRGRDLERQPTIIKSETVVNLFGGDITNIMLIVIGAAVVMMVALSLFVTRTRVGRGIRAVAQDAETATILGVNIDSVIRITFLLGGLMAGAAAALWMLDFEVTKYSIGFLLGIKAFTAAVLGGIGNLQGALLGGLVLGLIESYGSGVFGSQWRDVIAFVVLVVVLMFRPTGLLGESLGKARV